MHRKTISRIAGNIPTTSVHRLLGATEWFRTRQRVVDESREARRRPLQGRSNVPSPNLRMIRKCHVRNNVANLDRRDAEVQPPIVSRDRCSDGSKLNSHLNSFRFALRLYLILRIFIELFFRSWIARGSRARLIWTTPSRSQ